MEREFYTDEFEQLLKEKSDQFRMYPAKRVWHSIYNDLHPSRRWPSAAISIFLIIALLLIGYLNTSDNTVISQFSENNTDLQNKTVTAGNKNTKTLKLFFANTKEQYLPVTIAGNTYRDFNLSEPEFFAYTIVKNNKPNYLFATTVSNTAADRNTVDKDASSNNSKDLIQTMDTYIKSNRIYADIATAVTNKNKKAKALITLANNTNPAENTDENGIGLNEGTISSAKQQNIQATSTNVNKGITSDVKQVTINNNSTAEEKAWIDNFALFNKPPRSKWKNLLSFEFYATPAVNYRKLSTNSKGSAAPFANSDINNSISQKPGLGLETGLGITYAIAKKIQFKVGVQFNYTNYNIDADKTNHPILTSILLNDPTTGYSYNSFRTSTVSNAYNSTALQPVVLHNTTYQISIPLGLSYKLSSRNNVEWFTGASVQPTYIFGGNANLVSADLKSYVSDPSSIRNWNLNLGFETYMNYKLGAYNFQIGPQVRYQLFSTYRSNVALIEKPYAVGLKLGLVKKF